MLDKLEQALRDEAKRGADGSPGDLVAQWAVEEIDRLRKILKERYRDTGILRPLAINDYYSTSEGYISEQVYELHKYLKDVLNEYIKKTKDENQL